MSKELIKKTEDIREEVRVGANTSKRIGGILADMAREVNGLYENVLDWINNEKPQGGGFILTQSDIINNLNNESELKPLSAKQGKILKEILDELVVDNLETKDETKALSALQGKNLADDLREHNHDGIYQSVGNYATTNHCHIATDVNEDSTHRFMTDTEKYILSSLGTNAIQLVSQTLWSESRKDAYIKFSNGLLIQWGKHAGSNTPGLNIYLPMSFFDINYIVNGSIYKTSADNNIYIAMPHVITSKSSFVIDRSFWSDSGGVTSAGFSWLAIGRWK